MVHVAPFVASPVYGICFAYSELAPGASWGHPTSRHSPLPTLCGTSCADAACVACPFVNSVRYALCCPPPELATPAANSVRIELRSPPPSAARESIPHTVNSRLARVGGGSRHGALGSQQWQREKCGCSHFYVDTDFGGIAAVSRIVLRVGCVMRQNAAVSRSSWVETSRAHRCTFVAPDGRRCAEQGALEFHHRQPFANGGATTVENITLLCAAHHRRISEQTFGKFVVRDEPRGGAIYGNSRLARVGRSVSESRPALAERSTRRRKRKGGRRANSHLARVTSQWCAGHWRGWRCPPPTAPAP